MLLKWIVCDVGEEARASFSAAQEGWGKLASAPGFLGQIGGWDTRSENTACIISLWRDLTSYESFMGRLHHEIVAESEQSQTYRSISVTLFGDMIAMPGSRGMILDALEEGKIIRVADCTLKKGREGHFLEMQRDSWIPGMGKAEGMLGGMFWRVRDGGDRYLVTTVWQDRTSHQAYIDNIFPGLRARAAVEDDVGVLRGHLISLEGSWRVLTAGS
ncbi:MAG: YdbC family protein [Chloroflexi bacterium]|nr:YdbC family protein [Chloroflexota bacterium]